MDLGEHEFYLRKLAQFEVRLIILEKRFAELPGHDAGGSPDAELDRKSNQAESIEKYLSLN